MNVLESLANLQLTLRNINRIAARGNARVFNLPEPRFCEGKPALSGAAVLAEKPLRPRLAPMSLLAESSVEK